MLHSSGVRIIGKWVSEYNWNFRNVGAVIHSSLWLNNRYVNGDYCCIPKAHTYIRSPFHKTFKKKEAGCLFHSSWKVKRVSPVSVSGEQLSSPPALLSAASCRRKTTTLDPTEPDCDCASASLKLSISVSKHFNYTSLTCNLFSWRTLFRFCFQWEKCKMLQQHLLSF